MSEREKKFDPCEECPLNPNKVRVAFARRALRSLGIESEFSCPGPDVVDHFEAVSQSVGKKPPRGFSEAMRVNDEFGDKARGRTVYYRRTDRTEQCPNEPITLAKKEIVASVEPIDEGRLWVRIGKGDKDDVGLAVFDTGSGKSGITQVTSPEAYLTENRTIVRR